MALVVILAYALGSIPFALMVARHSDGPDPRRVGSGNPGAANVLRASGVGRGVLVALLDITKGALSVTAAAHLSTDVDAPAVAALAAIVGHVYPIWLRFRGGKGVATACGAFLALAPAPMGPALIVFVVTVWLTKYVSLGSVLASVSLPAIAYVTGSSRSTVATASAASLLIVFRHRSNLLRLHRGTEPRLAWHGSVAAGPVER